jgi:ethanolaminephosphotransferase
VFIVTHWEKYNTGVLFLSWAYDASQYGLSLFYLYTFFVGHQYFKFYVIDGISFANMFEYGFYVCCVMSFAMSFYNLYHSYYIDKTGKQSSFYECMVPMISPVGLYAASLYWAVYSPTHVIDTAPRLYFWTMGVIFSNIAVRLIISQMSNTRAETLNKLLILYAAQALLAVAGTFGTAELAILRLSAAIYTLAHLHYGICVVRQLCDHFNIMAFSLSYLQKKHRE